MKKYKSPQTKSEIPTVISISYDSKLELIEELIKQVESLETSIDFFNINCRLSSIFEKNDSEETIKIVNSTNLYVRLFNAVFNNKKFQEILFELLCIDNKISELAKDKKYIDKLIFINTASSLAVWGIALNSTLMSKTSIEFLRRHISDKIKFILLEKSELKISFVHLCWFLEKVMWDMRFHINSHYRTPFPIKLDDKFLFSSLKKSRAFGGTIFLSLLIKVVIEEKFKKVISLMDSDKRDLSKALQNISDVVFDLNQSIQHYLRDRSDDVVKFFDVFIDKNDQHLLFCLESVSSGFESNRNRNFSKILINKINQARDVYLELVSYFQENFSAFKEEGGEMGKEWTNKLFIVSMKTFAVLAEVAGSQNKSWAIKVALHEWHVWIQDIHEILNKYYLADDWDRVKDYLIQENEMIEWKSNFLTSTEQLYVNPEAELANEKRIFGTITKSILAMLNTSGGTLIVGVVEKPDAIKRDSVKENLITKNGLCFFDVSEELRSRGKTIDDIRLKIIQDLANITDITTDFFNDLVGFEQVSLKEDNRTIFIVKVSIKKSSKILFSVHKENEKISISLIRRASGQNICADIRDHVTQKEL